jgi:hypothetical protein
MEKVLTTNNGQANWAKLSTFGLHSRGNFIGFNRYSGQNGAVMNVDPVSGMKVLFQPASPIRSERAPRITFRAGKRGRPAQFSFPQQQLKRGRKPLTEAQRAERDAIKAAQKAELDGLVFYNHPQRKRGRKPLTDAEKLAKGLELAANPKAAGKKPGRKSEADLLKLAKKGDIIPSKGGYWLMVETGLPSWVAE